MTGGRLWLLPLAVIVSCARACSPVPGYQPPTLMDQALAASLVFRARMIEELTMGQDNSFNRIVRLEILEYLKGSGPVNQSVVVSGFSNEALCGISPPAADAEVIIFACRDGGVYPAISIMPTFSLNKVGIHTGYASATSDNLIALADLAWMQYMWLHGTTTHHMASGDTSIQFRDYTIFPCSSENSLHRDLDPCGLPHALSGDCLAAFQRWSFNTETGSCEQFTWGGCGGNSNNFQTEAACNQQCGVQSKCNAPPAVAGMCVGAIARWTYDRENRTCSEFTWGGCGGSANNFLSREGCEQECPILVVDPVNPCADTAADVGPCDGLFPRWTFNQETAQCEEFTWGGCQPNLNNFESLQECQNLCSAPMEPCKDVPADVGPCDAVIPRWTFNPENSQCEEFTWGGCRSSLNNFESAQECQDRCLGYTLPLETQPPTTNQAEPCMDVPADVGPCDAVIQRWTYNPETAQCEEFTWGGCRTSFNNFESLQKCQQLCSGSTLPVTLPPRTRPPQPNSCEGPHGTGCRAGYMCLDVPYDGCDPDIGDTDCPGFCQREVECGPLVFNACPVGLQKMSCVDYKFDECDAATDSRCKMVCQFDTPCNPNSPAIDMGSPVCGSDGRTYSNIMEFTNARCFDPALQIATAWTLCDDLRECNQDIGCGDIYAPVCASNGETYGNECLFEAARCRDRSLTIHGTGECYSIGQRGTRRSTNQDSVLGPLNAGQIAGIAAGAVALICLMSLGVFIYRKKRMFARATSRNAGGDHGTQPASSCCDYVNVDD